MATNEDDTQWRFVGFTADIDGKPMTRLYAHIEYATCRAVVAEEDRMYHRIWCESVVTR
jgi:hypothetical protein